MTATVLTDAWVRQSIPPRSIDAHKGSSGHVLLIAGSRGMSGAAALCTRGALRAGAGLVTTAVPVGERWAVTPALPEALTLLLPEDAEGHWTEEAITILD